MPAAQISSLIMEVTISGSPFRLDTLAASTGINEHHPWLNRTMLQLPLSLTLENQILVQERKPCRLVGNFIGDNPDTLLDEGYAS
jgi:hypothetical protein